MISHTHSGRLAVLVVTPYSPAYKHGHAADDIAASFFAELGRLVDLTVVAPSPSAPSESVDVDLTYELIHLSTPRYSLLRLLGLYPAAARKDWSRANTREVRAILRSRAFTNIHVEYMQPLEVLRDIPDGLRVSFTLHDIGTVVSRERVRHARGLLRKFYFSLDRLRIARLEKRRVKTADRVFALSESGREWVNRHGGRGEIFHLGRAAEGPQWQGSNPGAEFVFAGALWRGANQLTLEWLINEVVPRIPTSRVPIRIRVVGAGAPKWLIDLCRSSSAIVYVGEVDSFEEEYSKSLAVLAPTVVSAGILLKAQKALQCGAPLLVNSLAAGPLELSPGSCIVADDEEDLALAMVKLSEDSELANRVARSGQMEWLRGASWEDSASAFVHKISQPGG